MKLTNIFSIALALCLSFTALNAAAKAVKVNAEARVFNPAIVYADPGDTVVFDNMTSHNAVTYIKPEGNDGFGEKGKLPGGNFSASLNDEGIYGYVCEPHIGFGMVGVVVVGNVTQEMKDAALQKARDTLEGPFRRLLGKLIKIEVQ